MRTRTSLILAAALIAAGTGQRSVRADGIPFSTNGTPLVLEARNVPQVLTNLGYRDTKMSDGAWYVTVARPTLTIPVSLEVSGDRTTLWFKAKLGAVDTAHLPASAYRDLLSRRTSGSHFFFCDCPKCESSAEKDLMIAQSSGNRFVTQAYLRGELDEFVNTVVRLDKIWRRALDHSHSYGSRRDPFSTVHARLHAR